MVIGNWEALFEQRGFLGKQWHAIIRNIQEGGAVKVIRTILLEQIIKGASIQPESLTFIPDNYRPLGVEVRYREILINDKRKITRSYLRATIIPLSS